MSKKEIIKVSMIILIIFFVGFVIRVESTSLSGIPDDQKGFYQDQNGLPYMYELDSYYNYRLTKNYLDHGYFGDTLLNGQDWDLHSYYPPGRSAAYPPLIIYVAVIFYKLLNIFANVSLIVSFFWLPAVVGPLAGVVAYLFVRRFTNDYGGATAGLLTVTVPFYFIRTVPGWVDTDMFNVIFPLMIIWFLAEAVFTDNTQKRMYYSFLAALSTFLFSMAWEGWAYVFYIVIFSFLVYIILSILRKIRIKNELSIFISFVFLTLLFIVLTDISKLALLISPFNFYLVNSSSSWPNIYFAVGELGKASLVQVIFGLGFVFFAGILSFIWIFRVLMNKKLKKLYLNRMTWYLYTLLLIWTLIGFLAVTQGSRFIIILIPPFVITSGIMVGICVGYLDILKGINGFNIFRSRKNLIKVISIIIVVLVVSPGIYNDYTTFPTFTPGANDDLWAASEWVNINVPNDTVIISEWSYGHLFTTVSDHYVSVDGGSQNSPRTYWIYKAFATDNESLSLGIFNMIATSGDMGYLTLENYTHTTSKTVEILDKILGLDKKSALTVVQDQYGLNREEALNLLKYTHPDKSRPFILITSDEMMNKGYWTFYFGLWDFNNLNSSVSTYSAGKINKNSNIITSSDGLLMDLKNGNVTYRGEVPYSVITVEKGKVEKRYLNKSNDFVIVAIIDSNKFVVMDKNFENSLFTHLIIERTNTTDFTSIYQNNDVVMWKPKK